MAVEQGRCLFRGVCRFRPEQVSRPAPKLLFAIGAGMSGSIQLKTLDSTFIAPAIEQLLPNFHRRDVSKCAANFIRIENPGCVTVRVEKNQRARLIKHQSFGASQ